MYLHYDETIYIIDSNDFLRNHQSQWMNCLTLIFVIRNQYKLVNMPPALRYEVLNEELNALLFQIKKFKLFSSI